MSTGFHYFETLKQSLSLQWLSKDEAPEMLGKFISVGALASLITYGALWVCLEVFQMDFKWVYLTFGGIGFLLVVWMAFAFPQFQTQVQQNKTGAAQALLVVLRSDVYEWCTSTNLYCFRRLPDGGEVWLLGGRYHHAISDQLPV